MSSSSSEEELRLDYRVVVANCNTDRADDVYDSCYRKMSKMMTYSLIASIRAGGKREDFYDHLCGEYSIEPDNDLLIKLAVSLCLNEVLVWVRDNVDDITPIQKVLISKYVSLLEDPSAVVGDNDEWKKFVKDDHVSSDDSTDTV